MVMRRRLGGTVTDCVMVEYNEVMMLSMSVCASWLFSRKMYCLKHSSVSM